MALKIKEEIAIAKRNRGRLEELTIFDRFFKRTVLKIVPRFVTPNHLTVFRYLTVPFILFFLFGGYYLYALILFFVSVSSDALDGAVARTRGMVTDWGKIHDPLADKLLIGSVGAFLVTKHIDIAVILVIIIIEAVIIGAALYRKKKHDKVVYALLPGKIKMGLQSLALMLLLIYSVYHFSPLLLFAEASLYAAIFFALVSLFIYRSA